VLDAGYFIIRTTNNIHEDNGNDNDNNEGLNEQQQQQEEQPQQQRQLSGDHTEGPHWGKAGNA